MLVNGWIILQTVIKKKVTVKSIVVFRQVNGGALPENNIFIADGSKQVRRCDTNRKMIKEFISVRPENFAYTSISLIVGRKCAAVKTKGPVAGILVVFLT